MGNVLNRAEKNTCRQRDPKMEDINSNSILNQHSIFILLFFFPLKPQLFHQASEFSALPRQFRLQNRCLSRKCLEVMRSLREQSSVVLSVAQSASHRSDEGGSFAAAVFRK
uniref:Uncharacterized protein n=1 Tax=Micrurus carvalhoi TaxID=3147026 RepID=A0A2H6N8G7_9SAUR